MATQPIAPGPLAGCLWFPQTQHNVCDQTPTSGFKQLLARPTAWSSMAGQARATPESLALFGLPVTEPFQQTINGEMFQVQWFERARFEWHPGNADPYRVLLGRLGAEVQPAPGHATAYQSYASQDSPAEVLASFYNAINRQEYQRAYGYWETPPSPYDQFVQGYADTASVQLIVQPPTFIDVGAGNLHAAIPTVLVATKRDGSQQRFGGCYVTHKANIQPDVWHCRRRRSRRSMRVRPYRRCWHRPAPRLACPRRHSVSYADQNTPVDLLASFYNAINRQEYQRAYGYWETPPSALRPVRAGLCRHRQCPADRAASSVYRCRRRQFARGHPDRAGSDEARWQPADLRRLLHHPQSQHSARCLASRTRDGRVIGGELDIPVRVGGASVRDISRGVHVIWDAGNAMTSIEDSCIAGASPARLG